MNTSRWTRLPGWRWFGSAVLVLALITGCSSRSGGQTPATRAPTSTAPSASAPSTPSAPASTTPSGGSGGGGGGGEVRTSAADQLAGFFAGASRMDARLRAAAVLINGGVGRDVIVVKPATVAAVEAIQPRTLERAIPAGTSGALLRSVLLVYSDLASRRRAMEPVVHEPTPLPRTDPQAENLISCLGNGHAAAVRFGADLAAARALAARSAPIAAVAARSRQAAEVVAREQYIWLANSGCDGCGGVVVTKLLPLVWTSGAGDYHGTLGGVEFRADYARTTGWKVTFFAC